MATVARNRKYLCALCALALVALATAGAAGKKKRAVLVKEPERMFWSITGTDRRGNPSVVYIQGTIHVGDDRLYPLGQKVQEAWNGADRVAGEISSDGYAQLEGAMQELMLRSFLAAGGRNLFTYLSDAQRAAAYSLAEKDSVDALGYFEPWVLSNLLENELCTGTGFESGSGLDQWFIESADAGGRAMLGLDTLQEQLDLLCFGTYEQQLSLLQEALDAIIAGDDGTDELERLYEAYLADDGEALAFLLAQEDGLSAQDEDLARAYQKLVYDDRNVKWARQIEAWLSEGGTTFIFAGCAHFLGDASVFHYLKKRGVL